jgi:hypothetical protein
LAPTAGLDCRREFLVIARPGEARSDGVTSSEVMKYATVQDLVNRAATAG